MRAIDADALYRKVKAECNPYGKPSIGWKDGQRMMEWIEHAPTVGGWISVKDRLPNSNGCYIVWRPHFYPDFGMPAICYFDGTDTWHDSYGVDFERTLNAGDITHWQPLPEPPKEANVDE